MQFYTDLGKIENLQLIYNTQNGNVEVWVIEQMDITLSHKCRFKKYATRMSQLMLNLPKVLQLDL